MVKIEKSILYPIQGFLDLAQVWALLDLRNALQIFQLQSYNDLSQYSGFSGYPRQVTSSISLFIVASVEEAGIV